MGVLCAGRSFHSLKSKIYERYEFVNHHKLEGEPCEKSIMDNQFLITTGVFGRKKPFYKCYSNNRTYLIGAEHKLPEAVEAFNVDQKTYTKEEK